MAILNFVKPDKIVLQKATEFEANFEFRPLEPGYGVTIGNALRRVLLNSLEGYAIIGINIVGADHEFATLKGITVAVSAFTRLIPLYVGAAKQAPASALGRQFNFTGLIRMIIMGG